MRVIPFQGEEDAFEDCLDAFVELMKNVSRLRDLEVFSNVMDFREDWAKRHPEETYSALDDVDEFELDPLDNDESMTLTNVIGMGHKEHRPLSP